jgi:hypothetical protein
MIPGCIIISLAIITFGVIPAKVSADNGEVPLDLQAKLLLTALTYDKNMEKRANGKLDIGILYFPWVEQSKEEAVNFSKTLKTFQDKKIGGRTFDVFLFTYDGDAGLKERIEENQIEVLFIAGGKKDMVKEVVRITQSKQILSATSKADHVTSCGVSLAVGLKENKPKIYLNLSSAKGEGSDFSAKFLRIAEIVDKK